MMVMDKRQRAMLREMGVRVWQPMPQATPEAPVVQVGVPTRPESAIHSAVFSASIYSPQTPFYTHKQAVQATPLVAQTEVSASSSAWRVGAAQTLYAGTAHHTAARWLVLLEAPASALQGAFNPLEGDAGKLLDNMLRAAKLDTAGAVLLLPLVRSAANSAGGDLPGMMQPVFASIKADVVLVLGRLAAQALLQSTEPPAKLRGQVHAVQGQRCIISLEPTYLLRNPLEKAKAWDDVCLALSLT
jgi:uracil-DNA glycosylase